MECCGSESAGREPGANALQCADDEGIDRERVALVGQTSNPAVLSGVNRVGIGSLLVMVSLLYLQSANQNQRQHKSWDLYCTDLTQSKTSSCTPLRS